MDRENILAEKTHKEKLETSEKKHRNGQQRNPGRRQFSIIDQVDDQHDQSDQYAE